MVRVIADLHIHSKYSRATSKKMDVEHIARFAAIKGLKIVGTGDFTHPLWFRELKASLEEEGDTGLYRPLRPPSSPILFMLTAEVCTAFRSDVDGKAHRIHHVILAPSMEAAEQVSDALSAFGDLGSDGRPTLSMSPAELIEVVLEACPEAEVIPAHIWTPWFSLFGAFSGFDRIEDCYEDMTSHIHALETGLSSDPPMNWRVSALDKFILVSNSDSHSFYPWRIGREAIVFELEPHEISYRAILRAIRHRDTKRLVMTIEVNPAYGKYHWTGHRKCGISLPPEEAIRLGNRCPICGRELTKGVEQRVEELADRPYGFRPEGAAGYVHLLPLSEIIMKVIGASSPNSREVWRIYEQLVARFGDEYSVLLDAGRDEIMAVAGPEVAEAIVRVREGRVKVVPGYDGVYGELLLFEEGEPRPMKPHGGQLSLLDFM
ncbi:MAG TPA: DNA helicase UvrD [Candidatus Bathyarchaeota archaeon]|nr:DNA helicase UvrD [Candidatus Bathyarchaeota archaeon]